MDQPLWTGPAVALVTLFDGDGSVAAKETAEFAARMVAAGIRALVVAGTTGEAAALTDEERVELVTAVRAACPDVPLVAGTSADWREPAAARTAAAVRAGADAVLVAPPRLGRYPIENHYAAVVAAAGGVPVLAYHYPPAAGGDVPVDRLAGLGVSGIKDSSGDAGRLAEELDLDWPGAIYTGSASLLGYANWIGAAGAIVAVANAVPELSVAAWEGDATAQREVLRVEREIRSTFPTGIKSAVARRYGTSPACRLG